MADIELLPMPEMTGGEVFHVTGDGDEVWFEFYVEDDMRSYSLANVEHHTEKLRAEIDALRSRLEDATRDKLNAEARAKRLAEALREARDAIEDWSAYASDYFREKHNLVGDLTKIDDLLRDQGETQ